MASFSEARPWNTGTSYSFGMPPLGGMGCCCWAVLGSPPASSRRTVRPDSARRAARMPPPAPEPTTMYSAVTFCGSALLMRSSIALSSSSASHRSCSRCRLTMDVRTRFDVVRDVFQIDKKTGRGHSWRYSHRAPTQHQLRYYDRYGGV